MKILLTLCLLLPLALKAQSHYALYEVINYHITTDKALHDASSKKYEKQYLKAARSINPGFTLSQPDSAALFFTHSGLHILVDHEAALSAKKHAEKGLIKKGKLIAPEKHFDLY